jgi:hypothetical protein
LTRDLSDALFRFATVLAVPVQWTEGLVFDDAASVVDPVGPWRYIRRRSRVLPATALDGPPVERFIRPGRGTIHLCVLDESDDTYGWRCKPLCAGTPSEMAAYLNHLALVSCHLDTLRSCTAADIRRDS